MRYFFLAYALVALLVVGIFGFRGQKFSKPPLRVFPDMDEQDKVKAQRPNPFFADGQGARLPVAGTQPRGFNPEGALNIGGIPEYEFGGQAGYYYSGQMGDYYGTGMPEELQLTAENSVSFIERGRERYGIYCAVCHGDSGNGVGIAGHYGVPAIANFHQERFLGDAYPDGRMFHVITHGAGQMGAYGFNVPVHDRWAIIAYVRTLQLAKATETPAP
jgi:mono/diheme cytochrome c family protein